MPKDILFISHATHEDNYIAGWLASKLKLLGYNVFVDLENLRAGETFYTSIQPLIQVRAVKFISINTKNYIAKAADSNSGVRKEINAAATIRDDNNFIIPIRFDDIAFDQFPIDYLGRKAIDFNNNWGAGLKELIEELEKLSVPKSSIDTNPIALWREALKIKNSTIAKQEYINTNWFQINLPEFIYIHKPVVFDKSAVRVVATTILEANHIITFASPATVKNTMDISESKKYTVSEFINNDEIKFDENLTITRPFDKLKNLLNKTFKALCYQKGLAVYKQANKKDVFYFPFIGEKSFFCSLKKYGLTNVRLNGNKLGNNWHWGIDAKVELFPFPHYRVFYHVIFTDDNFKPIKEDDQHAARRQFGISLYNKKVYEYLLGTMLSLSPNIKSDEIQIKIGENDFFSISNTPVKFTSNTSYIEPKSE